MDEDRRAARRKAAQKRAENRRFKQISLFFLAVGLIGVLFYFTGPGGLKKKDPVPGQETTASVDITTNRTTLQQLSEKTPTDFLQRSRATGSAEASDGSEDGEVSGEGYGEDTGEESGDEDSQGSTEDTAVLADDGIGVYYSDEWHQKHAWNSQDLRNKIVALDTSQYDIDFMKPYMVGVAFSGDSNTTGLYEYFFLDESQVFGEIGGFLHSCDPYIDGMIDYNPSVICMLWGQNDMKNYQDDIDGFIAEYREKLTRLKENLPNTTIYVNAILSPRAEVYEQKPVYYILDDYNQAIHDLADELGMEYMDMNFMLEARPEFYCDDGVHVEHGFYKMWLIYLSQIAELGYEF